MVTVRNHKGTDILYYYQSNKNKTAKEILSYYHRDGPAMRRYSATATSECRQIAEQYCCKLLSIIAGAAPSATGLEICRFIGTEGITVSTPSTDLLTMVESRGLIRTYVQPTDVPELHRYSDLWVSFIFHDVASLHGLVEQGPDHLTGMVGGVIYGLNVYAYLFNRCSLKSTNTMGIPDSVYSMANMLAGGEMSGVQKLALMDARSKGLCCYNRDATKLVTELATALLPQTVAAAIDLAHLKLDMVNAAPSPTAFIAERAEALYAAIAPPSRRGELDATYQNLQAAWGYADSIMTSSVSRLEPITEQMKDKILQAQVFINQLQNDPTMLSTQVDEGLIDYITHLMCGLQTGRDLLMEGTYATLVALLGDRWTLRGTSNELWLTRIEPVVFDIEGRDFTWGKPQLLLKYDEDGELMLKWRYIEGKWYDEEVGYQDEDERGRSYVCRHPHMSDSGAYCFGNITMPHAPMVDLAGEYVLGEYVLGQFNHGHNHHIPMDYDWKVLRIGTTKLTADRFKSFKDRGQVDSDSPALLAHQILVSNTLNPVDYIQSLITWLTNCYDGDMYLDLQNIPHHEYDEIEDYEPVVFQHETYGRSPTTVIVDEASNLSESLRSANERLQAMAAGRRTGTTERAAMAAANYGEDLRLSEDWARDQRERERPPSTLPPYTEDEE